MNAKKHLQYLQNEIHSTVFATIDENGNPSTCVIDMMLSDEKGLYFLTAKGKAFYTRLKAHDAVSVTGFCGKDTMSSKSVTVRGRVRDLGGELLPEIFKANPYMAEIYPDEESRAALTVFQIHEGEGEFFDLSAKPIFRESFAFGGMKEQEHGYFVTDKCIGCRLCYSAARRSASTLPQNLPRLNRHIACTVAVVLKSVLQEPSKRGEAHDTVRTN